jgi:predicted ATPase
LYWAGWFHHYRGEIEAVQARVDKGMTLATEQGFSRGWASAAFLQGWLLFEQGHQEAGIAQMLKIVGKDQAERGSARWNGHSSAILAEAYRKTGQTMDGLSVVTEALSRATQTGCRYYEAELRRIKGELLLAQAMPEEGQAEGCFREAIEVSRRQQAKSLELRAAMSLSRLWQKQHKREQARQLLADIHGWFTEGFDTADLKAAKTLLEELA